MSEGLVTGVRCMLMRGGTSKGAYFLASDLPADTAQRDDLLLRVMGSPDPRQIDGVGGAHPLTSKVAIVSSCKSDDADVDYLFLQVGVDRAFVTDKQNCGNLLAGVGPFALERGLVQASGDGASVRIRMINTGGVATARFPIRDGLPVYDGECAIAGVPGTAAPIELLFEQTAGSTCGALFPTGRAVDLIEGIRVTCVDNGMPVVVLRAADVGIDGDESCDELEADQSLRSRIEQIRLAAGLLMGLGDVTDLTVPKITLVSPPRHGGTLMTRSFIPHRCHDAIGVLGAVSVATAALAGEGPAADVAEFTQGAGTNVTRVVVEHPTGTLDASVVLRRDGATLIAERSGIVRTARKLMDGIVFPSRRGAS
jgi:4-oxalomesaconate tautomerase